MNDIKPVPILDEEAISLDELQCLVDTGEAWQDEFTGKLAAYAIGSGMIGERSWT